MPLRRLSRLCDSRSRPMAKLLLVTAVLAVLLASCVSFKHLTQVSDIFPRAKECGKCHVEIYREWSQSDHARAYTNPHFQAATDDHEFEDCASCHAPEPTLTDRAPAVRAVGREEGVTCVACHLSQGSLCGPLEPTGKIHPHPISVRPEVYRSSDLCGRCHQGTFDEWNAAVGKKETCQQCHMNMVARKITQPTEGISHLIVAMEKTSLQRRHDLPILGDYIRGKILTVRGERNGSVLALQIANNLPHTLPTGDYGLRVVDLEVTVMDGQGRRIALERRELAPELSTAIRARDTLTWNIDVPTDAATAVVSLRRRSYEETDVVTLANVELPL